MSVILVYGRIYGACLTRALRAIGRSPWTLLLPVALWIGIFLAQSFLGGLGFLSGIISALALSALFSSYLYFVGELATDARVSLSELGKSFGSYFWAVVNLLFVVWVVQLLVDFGLARSPQAGAIRLIVYFAAFVLLNAAPEVIYLRNTYGGVATAQRSITFIQANWIEWFLPNVALGALFYFGLPALAQLLYVALPPSAAGATPLLLGVAAGAVFHVAMVFRGFLFQELDTTSHRQRMFKYRTEA